MVGISHHHHRHHRRVPSTILATGGCEELGLLPPQYQQHQQQQHQQHQQQQHQQQQQYPHHFGNLLTQQDYAYFGGVPHGGVPFQPPPPPPPKQVRFNVQANQVYRWTPSAPNSHLWYNVREMENFRTIAQVEAKQICSASSAYSSFVSRTSSTTHGISQWRREEMDKDDQNYPLQEHQEQQGRRSTRQQQEQEEQEQHDTTTTTTNSNLDGLIYWHCQVVKKLHEDCHRASVDGIYPVLSRSEQEIIFNAPQLLGLERWIKRLRRDKATRIEEMMHCIASISSSSSSSSSLSNIHQDDSHVPHHHHPYQQQQRRRQHEEMAGYFPSVYYGNHSYHPEGNHIPYHHHHHHHESNAEEWIRWHCERISLPSRLFAFYMAVAQCPPTAPTLSLSSSSSLS